MNNQGAEPQSRCVHLQVFRCTHPIASISSGSMPTPGACERCRYRRERIRGLGDVVALIISWTPLKRMQDKGCGGCKRRQERLNQIAPAPQARNCGKCGKSAQVP